MITKLKKDILDLIFPPRCLNCNRLGQFVCNDCLGKIIKIKNQGCPICHKKTEGGRLCRSCRSKNKLTGVIAYGYFHDPILKKIIHQYKYEGISAAGEEIASLLVEVVKANGIRFDVIAYAPVSRRRFNERGYNQAEILAKHLSKYFGKPFFREISKIKHTPTQVGLKRKDRIHNLEGTIVVKNGEVLKGKRIIIIDDVLTTGATLNECARALRQAGARQVWGVVLAKE